METVSSQEDAKQQLKRGLIAIAFVVISCGLFIAYLGYPLLVGTPVILKTRPVDPFDPLRGQYMIINYEVGNVPVVKGIGVGDTVYTTLIIDEAGIGTFDSISKDKPKDRIFLRGKIISSAGELFRIEYGIEQFFFERGADVPTRDISVRVKVASDGAARIQELLQDGKPVSIKYKT